MTLADQIIDHGPYVAGQVMTPILAAVVDLTEINQLRDELIELRKLRTAAEEMRALLADLVDDDPCWLDHHGYCQAHSLHSPPCPHARAKTLLAELVRRADEHTEGHQ